MAHYVINPADNSVLSYRGKKQAQAMLAQLQANGGSDAFAAGSPDDLMEVPAKHLVSIYNEGARKGEGKEIQRFPSKEAGANRTWDVVEFLAKPGEVVEAPKAEKAEKAKRTPRQPGESHGRGRPTPLAGSQLYRADNGRKLRETSLRGMAFASVPEGKGIKYEDLVAKHGVGEVSYLVRSGFLRAEGGAGA